MHKLLKTTGLSIICMSALALANASFAAESGRGHTAANARSRGTTATARMPSIPILPVSATGTMTMPKDVIEPDDPTPPSPTPPTPDDPDTPVVICPDGGVANSEYTVQNCMNDISACINGGALPNGINSMFNEELRNSIINGMGLCLPQVENCITTVRVNCANVYASASDVWLDFNARKVQPAYYSFVLRQTGLTPTQAKNTCLLLDRNTFGTSFNAVSDNNIVTGEYTQGTSAYNGQNSAGKPNPQGDTVNNTGVDGNRGYYARWDAEKAECLVRVAAYNKDELITNDWWLGGDKTPAEVWQSAGSTFNCSKDLFGFALRNKTKNMAVAAGGATVAGAAIGAWAGHGAEDDFDCSLKESRDKLWTQLKQSGKLNTLNMYIGTNTVTVTEKTKDSQTVTQTKGHVSGKLSQTQTKLEESQCYAIYNLYHTLGDIKAEKERCGKQNDQCVETVYNEVMSMTFSGNATPEVIERIRQQAEDAIKQKRGGCANKKATDVVQALANCQFKNIYVGTGTKCNSSEHGCIPMTNIQKDIETLDSVFNDLPALGEGVKSNRLKTTLVGGAIGAGIGGAATAITAFIERNNINCRVGDDLERVSFGKSYTIDRLRDFYVKWALNMPYTPAPTAVVTNCDNWGLTCSMFTDLQECENAQFNYRPGNLTTTQLVAGACKVSGSECVINKNKAHSVGACKVLHEDQEIPVVNNCGEWQNACLHINKASDCNTAKVIYAPGSVQVANACVFQGNICKLSTTKAGKYLDLSTCPTPANPEQPLN